MAILTLDVGTSSAKAALINEQGKMLSRARRPLSVHRVEPGASEHAPGELWAAVLSVLKEAVHGFEELVTRLVVSSYQMGVLLADDTLSPLTGLTLLSDIRAQQSFNSFLQRIDAADLYCRTGCPPLAQYAYPRIFYFQQRKPDLFRKVRYVLTSKDFLMLRLTGERVIDPSTAVATQLFELDQGQWGDDLLASVGLSPQALPRVVDGITSAFALRSEVQQELGLPRPVEVLAGVYDGGALSIALGGLTEGRVIVNLGTSAMLRVSGTAPVWDRSPSMRLQPYCLRHELFLNGGAVNNCGLGIDWLRGISGAGASNLLQGNNFPTSRTPFCLPYFTGERDVTLGPRASGVFFGLRPEHIAEDLQLALIEGIGFSLRLLLDALRENEIVAQEVCAGGGGACSALWVQLLADTFGLPVTTSECEEAALLGNASIGFAADGTYRSITDAQRAIVSYRDTVEPDVRRSELECERYLFFQRLRAQMAPLYL